MARPSIYTDELAKHICSRIAAGESLRAICREEGLPELTTVMNWRLSRPEFLEQYTRAREIQAETFGDELFEIVDDGRNDWMEREDPENAGYDFKGEHVQRARLRFDARRWWMSKVLPKQYGDKITNEHTGDGGGPIRFELQRIAPPKS